MHCNAKAARSPASRSGL